MKAHIRTYVAECSVCQQAKYLSLTPAGFLQALPIPDRVWEDISMDFIEGLHKFERYDVILVVADRLSKYAHFIPLKHPFGAKVVAAAFMREIIRLHGCPRSIVSDRDRVFTSLFWEELWRLLETQLRRSTTYHPPKQMVKQKLSIEGWRRIYGVLL